MTSLIYLRRRGDLEESTEVSLWDFILAHILSKLRGYNQLSSSFDMMALQWLLTSKFLWRRPTSENCLERGLSCCFCERNHSANQQVIQGQLKDLETLEDNSPGIACMVTSMPMRLLTAPWYQETSVKAVWPPG